MQRVRLLFEEALERDQASRAAFLDEATGGDAELRGEVESLLHALDQSGDLLEHSAPSMLAETFDESDSWIVGSRAGPYHIVRRVGHGGMGVVYEAVRADDQFRKRVAIKFLRSGFESELAVRRFRYERQILAGLDHPNIAGLLDGGVTADGQPYFVMEYVEGEPITAYCDSRGLSVRERVALFGQVCAAVQYAHEQLIVHRDLKPSNILVTADGTVKLLDFGIAKLLGEDGDEVPLTRGARALTPEYASPEHLRATRITTTSDVYSLGVVLYELLAGRRPHRLEGRLLSEIEQIVCETDPERPSAAVTDAAAAQRGERRAGRLAARLAGDLDEIVLMALRREPERRFGSAVELADDLRRHLDGLPVRARPDSATYRLRKFVRRRRTEVAAAGLVFASLLAGVVGIAQQARRAEVERDRAEARYREGRRLANALLFEIHSSIADLPGATAARATLVRRALEYLDGSSRVVGGDSSLDLELVMAYHRIGDVQGNPTNANLGDVAGARGTYMKALAIAERLAAAHADDPGVRRALALTHERLADVTAPTGEVRRAVDHQRSAMELYATVAEQTGAPADRHAVAVSGLKLGDLLGHPAFPNLGERAAALNQYREALRRLEALEGAAPDPFLNRRYRALVFERIGRLEQEGGDLPAAIATLTRSLELRRALAAERPASVETQRDLAIGEFLLCGLHLELGETAAALERCSRSYAIRERLYRADPVNAQLVRGMAIIHRRMGAVQEASGATERARTHYRASLAFQDSLASHGAATPSDQRDRTATLDALCARAGGGERLCAARRARPAREGSRDDA
jgi:non-specific serine/threonine protein kinase/serine/threonine-protein kinase